MLLPGEVSNGEFLRSCAGINVEKAKVFQPALVNADGCPGCIQPARQCFIGFPDFPLSFLLLNDQPEPQD